MQVHLRAQRGFTLIEILISIVLLAIILTSFMGFITQSAIFTKKNEQKLDTIQTAQIVVNMIEEEVTKEELISGGMISDDWTVLPNGTYQINGLDMFNTKFHTTFQTEYKLTILLTNKAIPNQPTNKLLQFKVIVEEPNNPSNKSVTYTYFRK